MIAVASTMLAEVALAPLVEETAIAVLGLVLLSIRRRPRP